MPRTALTAALALTLGAGSCVAQRDLTLDVSADESARLLDSMAPTNAATVYYQLFLTENKALMESYVHFNGTEEDDGTYGTTAKEAEEALAAGQKTLDSYVWASRLPDCDFGIQYQQGWAALLPHLGKMRAATRVLAGDAQRHLGAGDPDKSAERLRAIVDMSRQVREDRILISSLVSIAMLRYATEPVQEMMDSGELTAESRDSLIEAYEAFGDEDPFNVRECVKMEGLISLGWIAKELSGGDAGTKLAEWGVFGDGVSPEDVRRLDALSGPEVIAEAEKMLDYYRGVLEVWDEPDSIAQMEALGTVVGVGGFGEMAKGFGAAFDRARSGDLKAQKELQETLDALRAYRPELLEAEETEALPATH